jgi:hypothetical protein
MADWRRSCSVVCYGFWLIAGAMCVTSTTQGQNLSDGASWCTPGCRIQADAVPDWCGVWISNGDLCERNAQSSYSCIKRVADPPPVWEDFELSVPKKWISTGRTNNSIPIHRKLHPIQRQMLTAQTWNCNTTSNAIFCLTTTWLPPTTATNLWCIKFDRQKAGKCTPGCVFDLSDISQQMKQPDLCIAWRESCNRCWSNNGQNNQKVCTDMTCATQSNLALCEWPGTR